MAEIAAIILAAGRASRFGAVLGDSKVLAVVSGLPMIRHVANAALASRASPVLVVTGNAAAGVAEALVGLPVSFVANADWATGMAGSLKAGLAALPATAKGALILLGDMPLVTGETLDRLIASFDESGAPDAIIPVHDGRQGNPVLIGRALFGELDDLTGDEGARTLLKRPDRAIVLCPVNDSGIAIDVDTPDALRALQTD